MFRKSMLMQKNIFLIKEHVHLLVFVQIRYKSFPVSSFPNHSIRLF